METSHRILIVLFLSFVAALVGYGFYAHYHHGKAPPSELKTGVQALSDPESLVKDLDR